MKGRFLAVVFIVLALLSGFVAVYFSNQYIENQVNAKKRALDKEYAPVEVVVANFDLNPGDVISPDTVSLREVPSGFVHSDAISKDDFAAVNGFAISYSLGAGEVLLRSHLSQRKGGKFAALIDAGRRAVTVSIDSLSSAAGMLSPTDKVDILLTTQKNDKLVTLPLLGDIRIIATGIETSENPSGEVIQYNTVTLDLSPEEAARVTHARKVGEISFVLRGSEETGQPYDKSISKTSFFNDAKPEVTYIKPVEMIIGGRSFE